MSETYEARAAMHREVRRGVIEEQSLAECDRQDLKWGADRDLPNGTGGSWRKVEAIDARNRCQRAFADGKGTWQHIFTEEVAEALAESNPAKLRTELIQCRAVLTQWIDNIDRTAAAPGGAE